MVGLTRRASKRLLARGNHALAVLVVETSLGSTARQALAARLLAVASSRHPGVSLSRHEAQVMAFTFCASCTRRMHGELLSSCWRSPSWWTCQAPPGARTLLSEEQLPGLVARVSHLGSTTVSRIASNLQVWNSPPPLAGFEVGGAMGRLRDGNTA